MCSYYYCECFLFSPNTILFAYIYFFQMLQEMYKEQLITQYSLNSFQLYCVCCTVNSLNMNSQCCYRIQLSGIMNTSSHQNVIILSSHHSSRHHVIRLSSYSTRNSVLKPSIHVEVDIVDHGAKYLLVCVLGGEGEGVFADLPWCKINK